jgi:hypothetical protein
MINQLTKSEMITGLNKSVSDLSAYCESIPPELFFAQPADKWSIAQNIIHLCKSAKMTALAYRLPKFIVRLYAGKPNRPSRNYDELVAKYKTKLEQGGKASGPYIPEPAAARQTKEMILESFKLLNQKLVNAIERNWQEEKLDHYLAPHPLLGKITLRELIYFTIYHTWHHLDIIKRRG